MELKKIREHWVDWATRYEADLRSTTKTPTIKQLEIDAFARAIQGIAPAPRTALEVGCGNLINTLTLARRFPGIRWVAADYLPEMVANSIRNRDKEPDLAGRIEVAQGDIRAADAMAGAPFDVVICDRVVINLNTWQLQREALDSLVRAVRPGGHLLLIENTTDGFGEQNRLRTAVGLPARAPAEFNLFLDDRQVREYLEDRCDLVHSEDFATLHDVLLYVLTPLMNGGDVDYGHPLVKAATELTLALPDRLRIGSYGQNRLYVFRRR
jgi:SAM-dependent methyltransferase